MQTRWSVFRRVFRILPSSLRLGVRNMFAADPPKDNSGWKWTMAIAVVIAVASALANEGARLVADIVRDRVIEKKPDNGKSEANK